ncbi:MAG: TonB-dependent receptor [Asticcacaulis sp.]
MMDKNFKRGLMSAAGLIGLMMAVPAMAQSQAAAAAKAAVPASDVEEVVVTIQKREQATVNVPLALTAYSGGTLEKLGITDFAQLSSFVPGFQVQDQSPNNPGFVMRGVTTDDGSATSETRVSVFQDGVSISRSRGSYVELFDINRVEVAKGPQSTLFGRGALIGAVNIVQNKPSFAGFDANFAVGAGTYSYRLTEGMVNLPLGDMFAVRLSGRVKSRDGYVDNLLGGQDFNGTGVAAGRLSLAFRPNDTFRADLILNHERDATPGTAFKSGTYVPVDPNTGKVLGDLKPQNGAALSSSAGFMDGRDLGLRRTVEGATLLMTYKLSDSLTLNSITASRQFDSSEVFDADGFSLPLFVFGENAKGRQLSQELRVNFDNGGAFSGFVGASYFDEKGRQSVPLQFDERTAALFLGGALTRPAHQSIPQVQGTLPFVFGPAAALIKPAHRETYTNYGETRSVDVFGDLTFKATEQLELSAGVRYTKDDKKSAFASTLDNGGSVLAALTARLPVGTPVGLFVQPTNGKVEKSFEDDGLTYRLVARYAPSKTVSLYASYARGRQPKVLNASTPLTPFGAVVFSEAKAETVDSLEVGAKARLMDGRLSLDGAVYQYEYKNFQTQIPNPAGTGFLTVSAGEAKSYGFEGQADFKAADWAQLFATYAYTKARFGNGRFDGNRFRLSPDHKVSLGATFKADFAGGDWAFTPTYTWQSETVFSNDNDLSKFQVRGAGQGFSDIVVDEKQKAFGLLNLRLTYTPTDSNLTVEGFVENALDQEYIKDAGNTGDNFGIATFIAGAPRTSGVVLRLRY